MLKQCLVAICVVVVVIVIVIVVELWCHSPLCPPYEFIYIHNDNGYPCHHLRTSNTRERL